MFKKIQASFTFRRNTPGRPMRSIKNRAKYLGQLYTFQYTSFGSRRIKKHNKDARPLLLLAYKEGSMVWKAKNGKKYIYGFNLNYLPPHRRLKVIKKLQKVFEENQRGEFTYQEIKGHLDLPATTEDTIFRKYDIRGSKLRYLKEVNLNTYRTYLEEALD